MVTFCLHVLLNDVWHRTGDSTLIVDMLAYYRASYNSSAAPESARASYLKKVGLKPMRQNSIIGDVLIAVEACENKIRASRANDNGLGAVITPIRLS